MSLRKLVWAVLAAHGPLSANEVAEELGANVGSVKSTIGRVRAKSGGIRVAGYRTDTPRHPRALFALGRTPDAPRPPRVSPAEKAQRYRVRKAQKVASVFEWRSSL